MKGFVFSYLATSIDFALKFYQVSGPRIQIYKAVTLAPWALKPLFGVLSVAHDFMFQQHTIRKAGTKGPRKSPTSTRVAWGSIRLQQSCAGQVRKSDGRKVLCTCVLVRHLNVEKMTQVPG
ncbi:unnamed protein product [Amoebophrya sp. A120]|nr:unnamed protein product [Amoebophrya sp. A120]|eukprot:GSA120T00002955001.1